MKLNRRQFSDHLRRQNDLVIDGWRIIRFSYDDVMENARTCQQTIQQLLGSLLGPADTLAHASAYEREILRLAVRLQRPLAPRDLRDHFGISPDFARDLLHRMVHKGRLQPARGVKRIRTYRLSGDARSLTPR